MILNGDLDPASPTMQKGQSTDYLNEAIIQFRSIKATLDRLVVN
jgi:hypothetical protein